MTKGYFISRTVLITCAVVAVAAAVTIIALSALYAREKSKRIQPTPASTKHPSTTPEGLWNHHRLPDTLVPLSYNVTLWPQLKHKADGFYVFTGNSTVIFSCVKETEVILIHCFNLNLTQIDGFYAKLTTLGGGSTPSLEKTWLDTQTQYLVIRLRSPMKAGAKYELFTGFTGKLSDTTKGFYRSEYMEDGVTKVVASTQMEPTYARKVFPCFDEPAMKAVFYISLIHPDGTVALSNSMNLTQTRSINMKGQSFITTRFKPTKVMSTYLLAFVVSEFTSIGSSTDGEVLIRIWARKKAIQEEQGNYALEKAGPILAFFEKNYNVSYPLTKSDQVALPQFNGAMENWGLITYEETLLLCDPTASSNEDKERLATIISHELAHMWFGNLVTMKWWNDLWLNEGFATYVSYLGVNYAEPSWNFMTDFLFLKGILDVMDLDASGFSHPLSSKEEDIMVDEDIIPMFDSITYKKGAAVLRMLSVIITETVFSRGFQTYLKEFQYKNTVSKDLWKHLQMAVEEAGISLPHSVENIMNRWTLQMGFPLITINTQTGQINQTLFLLNPNTKMDKASEYNSEWFVHITWIKSGGEKGDFWLLDKEDTKNSLVVEGNDWLVANRNMTGFYRVIYDEKNWERILYKLASKHQDIPVINRAQIIDDAFSLVRADIVDLVLALNITKYLNKEVEFLPWQTFKRNLDFLSLVFEHSEVYKLLQAYLKQQVTPLFYYYKDLTLDWTRIPEKHTDQNNQGMAIALACGSGLNECTKLTSDWFKELMKNPAINKINPNLRAVVYCSAIETGGEEEWNFALTMYRKATVASEAEMMLKALSCTKNTSALSRYIEHCLDPEKIRKQHTFAALTLIAGRPSGHALVWEFVRTNWKLLQLQSGFASSFGKLFQSLTSRFSTELQLTQLLQFLKSELVFYNVSSVHNLRNIPSKKKFVAQNEQRLLDWLLKETSKIHS